MAHRHALRVVLVSGAVGSASSAAALAWLARAEGKGMLHPVNATSHWLHGERAASLGKADLGHTLLGYATHQVATWFWAALLERWTGRRPGLGTLPVLGQALAVSTLAALVDYRATPRRFTPGWEFVLSRRSMAAAYVAMGLGLAAGTLGARRIGRTPAGSAAGQAAPDGQDGASAPETGTGSPAARSTLAAASVSRMEP